MNKQFRSLAVRLMAVLLLAALVIPAYSAAKASDIPRLPAVINPEYSVWVGLSRCDFSAPTQSATEEVQVAVPKYHNTSGSWFLFTISDTRTVSHSLSATAGFNLDIVSAALTFTVTETRTITANPSVNIPPHHMGKIKIIDRYIPYVSRYDCYLGGITWNGGGEIIVKRYAGTDYRPVVKAK